ncbi:uncharacterized protein LOC124349511 [Daphnia pulicaria]|uniref:uncharacterized protein LOC124349511 n=1 Tax=Daphnia pulicaria TaxID=35523 RepID=UPI001EEB24BD|nr:uncharacterized protein LOC124349511 [Daphnia pulicaria]
MTSNLLKFKFHHHCGIFSRTMKRRSSTSIHSSSSISTELSSRIAVPSTQELKMMKLFLISLIGAIFMTTVSARLWEYSDSNQVRWSTNCNFLGSDYLLIFAANDQCGKICLDNWGCTHFTASRTSCSLKRNTIGWTESFSRNEVSGFIPGRSTQSVEPRKPAVKN